MIWTNRYIGIPFAFDGRDEFGCDCWGLVRLVYLYELGIKLPEIKGALTDQSAASLRRVAKAAKAESERWQAVNRPAEFDVILLRRGNINCHVGIVCGRDKMLHIEDGTDAVVTYFTAPLWQHRVSGFFHYDR